MSRIQSLESMFVNDYLRKLKEAEEAYTQYMTLQVLPHDDYATRVGYLQALKEMRTELQNLLNAYFPNE